MSRIQRLTSTISLRSLTTFFGIITLFLLPLHTRYILLPGELNSEYWEYGTWALYALDIPFGLFVLCGLMTIAEARTKIKRLPTLGLLGVALFTILSVNESHDSASSFLGVVVVLKALTGAFIWIHIPFSRSYAAWTFISSGVLQSIIALMQYIQQRIIPIPGLGMSTHLPEVYGTQVIEIAGERILRAYGALPHPNMLGGFLMVAGLCAIGCTLSLEAKRFERILGLIATFIISAGLWTSLSRSAFLGFCVGSIVLYGMHSLRNIPLRWYMILSIICVAVPHITLTALEPRVIATRLFGEERLEQYSLYERQQFIEDSSRIIGSHALWGIGVNQSTSYIYAQDEREGNTAAVSTYQPVHVVPVLVWQEIGLFGLIAWLCCIAIPFLYLRMTPSLLFLPAYIGLCVIALFDHYLWSLPFGVLLLWCVYALSLPEQHHTKNTT